MLIKFFHHGVGRGSGSVGYVLRSEGRENALPEVLRGEPIRTQELIDSIERKWRYTSGVLSFALEDAPTAKQQEEVMDAFERTAFSGLDADQYDILWVRHQHTSGGRVELHFVVPRVELHSGKSLNIAPPGWKSLYAPLRDALNYEYGWARPDDENRARTLQRATESVLRGRDRESIGKYLEGLVEASMASNRGDLVEALQEVGFEVTRQGKDYITVKDPEKPENKGFRLKGTIYAEGWTADQYVSRETSLEAGERTPAGRGIDRERAEDAWRELEERINKRAAFHAKRYPRADGHSLSEPKRAIETDLLDVRSLHRDSDSVLDVAFGGDGMDTRRPDGTKGINALGAAQFRGIEGTDRGSFGDEDVGRNIFSSTGRDITQDDVRLQQSDVSEIVPGKLEHGQDNAPRTRIAKIRREVGRWYETGRRELTIWFDGLRKHREYQHGTTLERSRAEANHYRKNARQRLEQLSTANDVLRETNRRIEQATNQVRPIVHEKEKQKRGRNQVMER